MTEAVRLEVLVEEPSAERALGILLPKIVPSVPFAIRTFLGKDILLKELPQRLRAYANRILREQIKIVVLVDRDNDDCLKLKNSMERAAADAGLTTQTAPPSEFLVLNRIIVEELEAWFFGDVCALRQACPKVSANLGNQAKYRDPDAIPGGTWEALERVLQERGYHRTGLKKFQVASDVAQYMDVESNRSKSFQVFRDGLRRLVSEGSHAQTD